MLTFILPLAAFQIDLIDIKIENDQSSKAPQKNEIVIEPKITNVKELKNN